MNFMLTEILWCLPIRKSPNFQLGSLRCGGRWIGGCVVHAAGLLLVISSAVAHDLGKSLLKPNMKESEELWWARGAATLAVVIAGYLGINPPGFVAQVVAFAFGLAASSFFPIIVLGIFSKRTTKEGGIAGMLTGIAFTTGYIVYYKFMFPDSNGPENWLFGISPEGIGSVGMVLNFAVTILVSRFTPPPPDDVQESVERIRSPGVETLDPSGTSTPLTH